MNKHPDMPEESARTQDYAVLRAELATLTDHLAPFVDELWPRLENHRYNWQLYGFGVRDGYEKLIAADIVAELAEALKSISYARDRLHNALSKTFGHNPDRTTTT
ncbi:hypothetical protein [Mycobacterium marinum]|uniref:hypothetical protein n=1 Tax=Mycobacterium marinum TaxID=1781 RepID=UPI00235A1B57|nr:hypothetical protein [Mycobacterium marinum]MDC8973168.1 hypothetical protein [Mycobacterium marinum]